MGNAVILLLKGLLIGLFVSLFAVRQFNLLGVENHQQYSWLASSFLDGKACFGEIPGSFQDLVDVGSLYCWPLGPLPAVVLVPTVYIFEKLGAFFYQGYFQFVLNLGVFFFLWYLARKKGYTRSDSGWMAGAFMFASVYQYVGLVSWSWYFAQVLGVFLTLAAIGEWKTDRRWWVIGVLMGAVFACRFTAGLGVLFFLMLIIFHEEMCLSSKLKSIIWILVPVIFTGILLLGYNLVRFGNGFDNGYTTANTRFIDKSKKNELEQEGLFNLKYVKDNAYYYFFKTLEPKRGSWSNKNILPDLGVGFPGTSFFVVSPVFLFLIRTELRTKELKAAAVTSGIILMFLLAYYWPGWRQVGPRYMVDLLPYIYLLFLESFRKTKLSLTVKALIVASSLFNLYLHGTSLK